MRRLFAIAVTLFALGCESTTTGPTAPWGNIADIAFAPVDMFFVPTAATNGDYNFVLVVADQVGFCNILQQNINGYPTNINAAYFTFSNPVGTGPINPSPGLYPVTDAPDAGLTAQAAFQSISGCTAGPTLGGTSGTVIMQDLAVDLSQMDGTVQNVQFAPSAPVDGGTLSGVFSAYVCDTSQSTSGPSTCYQ